MKILIAMFLLCSIQILSQPFRDVHQNIVLNFNEPMKRETLTDIENFVCYSENWDTLVIYKVLLPIDTSNKVQVAVETDQFEHNLEYTIKVYWAQDLAGNIIAENNMAWVILPLIDSTLFKPQNVEIE